MLFKFKDGKIIVINFIRVCVLHAYSRIDLHVEMLFKLHIRRLYQKVRHSLPKFRIMRQHFSTMLRSHFKQQNHQQNTKNVKNASLNRPGKGPLSTLWHLKQEDGVSPSLTSAGNVLIGRLRFFATYTCPPVTTKVSLV